VEPKADVVVTKSDDVRARQCGRCRLMFAGDPELFPAAIPDWWLCPDCKLILLAKP
jgi:hypothetical protein